MLSDNLTLGASLVTQMVRICLQCGRPQLDGGGHGNAPQYSCLENHMDRGACRATVLEVAKSLTPPGKFHIHFQSDIRTLVKAKVK